MRIFLVLLFDRVPFSSSHWTQNIRTCVVVCDARIYRTFVYKHFHYINPFRCVLQGISINVSSLFFCFYFCVFCCYFVICHLSYLLNARRIDIPLKPEAKIFVFIFIFFKFLNLHTSMIHATRVSRDINIISRWPYFDRDSLFIFAFVANGIATPFFDAYSKVECVFR